VPADTPYHGTAAHTHGSHIPPPSPGSHPAPDSRCQPYSTSLSPAVGRRSPLNFLTLAQCLRSTAISPFPTQ
jgi:hypothetical protein